MTNDPTYADALNAYVEASAVVFSTGPELGRADLNALRARSETQQQLLHAVTWLPMRAKPRPVRVLLQALERVTGTDDETLVRTALADALAIPSATELLRNGTEVPGHRVVGALNSMRYRFVSTLGEMESSGSQLLVDASRAAAELASGQRTLEPSLSDR